MHLSFLPQLRLPGSFLLQPEQILGLVSLGSLCKESDSTSKASARKNRNDVDPA